MPGHVDTIVQCSRPDLQPGKLGTLFREGAKAAVVNNDPRVKWLWDSFLGLHNGSDLRVREMSYPWESTVEDIARNHQAGSVVLGDMLRFAPGALGHIARKSVLFKDSHNEIKTIPDKFYTKKSSMRFKMEALEATWDLMQDILRSTLPQNCVFPNYAVKIELLKYPNTPADLDKISTLLSDASGYWTQIGMQLDQHKARAASLFDFRWMRDLYALGTLIPGVNNVLRRINGSLLRFSKKHVPENAMIIGDPHVDAKILTTLMSDRDVLKTEVYENRRGRGWVELPLSCNSLAIFPSNLLSKKFKISPTTHRILLKKHNDGHEICKSNVTLNLSLIPWPQEI